MDYRQQYLWSNLAKNGQSFLQLTPNFKCISVYIRAFVIFHTIYHMVSHRPQSDPTAILMVAVCLLLQSIYIYIYIYISLADWMQSSNMAGEILPGVGVTKALFVNFSASKIFDLAKVPVKFLEYHWYLAGVTAAELQRHLPNINVIFKS